MLVALMNVITKAGTVAKGGKGLHGEELIKFCTTYIAKYGYSPQVLPTGETIEIDGEPIEQVDEPAPTVAVAKSIFAEMAEYVIRNRRACNPAEKFTDKDGKEYHNPYHWSGVIRLALRGGTPVGKQLTYLERQHSMVEVAVSQQRKRNRTFPLVDLEDLDWSF